MKDYSLIRENDPRLYEAITKETERQRNKIELIASENFVSEVVMEANGTTLTNKYAEGYPGRRYYGGCEHVDTVESIAIERAKEQAKEVGNTFHHEVAFLTVHSVLHLLGYDHERSPIDEEEQCQRQRAIIENVDI